MVLMEREGRLSERRGMERREGSGSARKGVGV